MSKPLTRPKPLPTVSRSFDDGSLVELLYDAGTNTTQFAVRDGDGRVHLEPSWHAPTGEHLVPYSAGNTLIASKCVLLPSAVGDVGDKGEVLAAIRSFLRRYVDLSPAFEDIAPYYVLLSWVYDAFRELPMLRFRGDYGTGKTRALLAVGSLCHKPFFASGASTVSPLFHILDAFRGTLVLDEADFRFSDATAELTKVLNNGTVDGLPVLRTMPNRHGELNPRAFRVFGPKLIAMRSSFSDEALESRFITEETGGRALRADIPIHVPDTLAIEALDLRNQLLAWRLATLHTVRPDDARLMSSAEPRLNQTALALLSLVDEEDVRRRIERHLLDGYAPLQAARGESLEAVMIGVVATLFASAGALGVPVGQIALAFNDAAAADLGRPMSNRWVGGFLRGRLRLRTTKSGGVYIVPREERPRVEALAARAGVA